MSMKSFLCAYVLLHVSLSKAMLNTGDQINDSTDAADRELQEEQSGPGFFVVVLLFGGSIMSLIYLLSRSSRSIDRQEDARQERLRQEARALAFKEAEQRRKDILHSFEQNKLSRKLEASDITLRTAEDEQSFDDVDIEQGTHQFGKSGIEETNSDKVVDTNDEAGKNDEMPDDHTITHTLVLSETISDSPQYTLATDAPLKIVDDGSIPEAQEASESAINSSDIQEVDIDGNAGGKVLLPQDNGKPPLTIAITCAICLERYQEGETVVWSGNPLCRHGFHQQCILDYLVHENQQAAPCPCCRRVFLPMK